MAKQEVNWKKISPDMVVFRYDNEQDNEHNILTVKDVEQFLDFIDSIIEEIDENDKDFDVRAAVNTLEYLGMLTLKEAQRQFTMIRTLGSNRPLLSGVTIDGESWQQT